MARPDDDEAHRPVPHEIGAKLDDLSVFELEARIQMLKDEILRLEQIKSAKQNAAAAASAFFKT